MRLRRFIRSCLTSDLSRFLARRIFRQAFTGVEPPVTDLLKIEISRRFVGEQVTLASAYSKREVIDRRN